MDPKRIEQIPKREVLGARSRKWLVLLCLFTPVPGLSATEVSVYPWQNLESVVSSYPSGTTFLIKTGVHRMQYAVPKNYDVFVGESGAVLDGAKLLTSFSQSGTHWEAHVSVTYKTPRAGVCDSAHPECDHPEDLFFDSVPQRRVASLSQVGPGKWYLDYSTGTAYMGSDPSGHTVEISLTPYAFQGSATGVKISSLVIEKYATPGDDGTVGGKSSTAPGSHWKVEWNDIKLNHGMGIRLTDYMYIYANKLHQNGELGVGGAASYATILSNEVYSNNFAGYTRSYGGGVKVARSNSVAVRYNDAHDNAGPGLWADINSLYTLFEHNHTSHNQVAGIFVEVSYHTTIRYNNVDYDGFNSKGSSLWWGAGILVNSSPYVNVYSNTVSHCMNGIGAIQSSRGTGPYGEYLVKDLSVYDNTIYQVDGTAEGIVKSSVFDNSVYTDWNNHFSNDTYYFTYPTYLYFYWLDADHSLTWWLTYDMLH